MSLVKRYIWDLLTSEQRDEVLRRPAQERKPRFVEKIIQILERVKTEGDKAAIELTEELDKVKLESFAITAEEINEARSNISRSALQALERAKSQLEIFHLAQKPSSLRMEVSSGVFCGQVVSPIDCVGLYVPGGNNPLPSSVLMLGVPAAIADCPRRILCTPPGWDGLVDPHILVAADLCGISEIYKIGGAQAIAAMAFGTESIPKVNKIFGPGGVWVTQAKTLVASDPSGATCDMPAGPSELMVIVDESANPAFVASDLLSQAEHGVDSQVSLVTTQPDMEDKVLAELDKQLPSLPRKLVAKQSLSESFFIQTKDIEEAIDVANTYAPEHLIMQVKDASDYLPKIRNAGSVFLGLWSTESMGDYASGTNHVLPTYGYAKSVSGISVDSFLKKISFQELTEEGMRDLGPTVEVLAEVEGLQAHKNAVTIRLEALKSNEGKSPGELS